MSGLVLVGKHGTDLENVESILQQNFKPSRSERDWIGNGVYFFIDGIGDPAEHAAQWARSQSFAGYRQQRHYEQYAVVSALVKLRRYLDLRKSTHVEAFSVIRTELNNRLKRAELYNQQGYPQSGYYNDCRVCNYLLMQKKLCAIVKNDYIKHEDERRRQINSNIPNCTIMCVRDAQLSIELGLINVVRTGDTK